VGSARATWRVLADDLSWHFHYGLRPDRQHTSNRPQGSFAPAKKGPRNPSGGPPLFCVPVGYQACGTDARDDPRRPVSPRRSPGYDALLATPPLHSPFPASPTPLHAPPSPRPANFHGLLLPLSTVIPLLPPPAFSRYPFGSDSFSPFLPSGRTSAPFSSSLKF
jgi:hypothetical protein